ncbi:MAG: DUF4936 family protein [Burkholderiales bacterium]
MRELFVYYRIRADDAEAALVLVRGLQARLTAQHPGLTARLLRRPESTEGVQTWMETYAIDPRHAPAGIGPELQAAIDTQALTLLPLLEGPRHAEVFVACAW